MKLCRKEPTVDYGWIKMQSLSDGTQHRPKYQEERKPTQPVCWRGA